MTNSVTNVTAGKPLTTGGLLRAPSGSTLPTDASTALDAAFLGVGYLGDEGIDLTPSRSTDKVKAWGGDVILVTQTEFGVEAKFTLAEALNEQAAKTAFGDANVTATAGDATHGARLTIEVNSAELDRACWVAEVIGSDGQKVRVVIPIGQPTGVDTIPIKDSDAVKYPVTLTTYPDSSGNNIYIYTDDGVTVV